MLINQIVQYNASLYYIFSAVQTEREGGKQQHKICILTGCYTDTLYAVILD